MKKKFFAKDEFMSLLVEATGVTLRMCFNEFNKDNLPQSALYVVPGILAQPVKADKLIEVLLDELGRFRSSIRLLPIARTDNEIVIEVCWGDDRMDLDEWVDQMPPSGLKSKWEPFLPMSPSKGAPPADDSEKGKFTLPVWKVEK